MLYLAIAVAAIAVLIFVPIVRRVVGVLLSIGITLGAIGSAVFGITVLMNNVAINERPGIRARVQHFLTTNWAVTSDKGLGSLTCEGAEKSESERQAAATKPARTQRRTAKLEPTPTPTSTPAPSAEEDDVYPELVQRGYPGVPRPTLFKLAKDTVNQLEGWKLVKDDDKTFSLDCEYTTRLFHWIDDVKIEITPRGEIHLCSRSRVGKGDSGANLGHIKEFYTALEPKVDEFYKQQEEKQNAQPRR